jgi:hypothetical protein
MPRIARHAFTVAAALAVAASGVWPASLGAQTWKPTEDDLLLLELHSGQYRLGETLRGYQTPSGICVDFADLIQAMDLPVRLDRKSRRATGWLFAESETFTLDRDKNTVQTMNAEASIPAGAVVDTPGGWCIDTQALSGWFGVTFKPDLGNLVIKLETTRTLPFLQAIERRSRAARLRPDPGEFDLSSLPRAQTPYKAWRTPAIDVILRANWNKTGAAAMREFGYEVLASGEVLHTSYQARLVSSRSGLPGALRLQLYRKSEAGRLLGPLGATAVAAGDVETPAGVLTGQSAVGRGLYITNRPMAMPSRFGRTTVRGNLPNGWDAELYRNGELLAFQTSRPDGRYEFPDVALLFGDNDLEVVVYGPQGQIRREASQLPVGMGTIPAGKTWYWAGALEANRDLIEFGDRVVDPLTGWRWGVGVERGIDKRTSAGIEAQSLVVNGQRETYIEANVRRAVGPMLVQLSGAHQLGRGQAFTAEAIGKLGAVYFRGKALWIAGEFESEVIEPRQSREFGADLSGSLKLGPRGMPWQAGFSQKVARDGTKVNEWYTRLSVSLRRLAITGVVSGRHETGPRASADENGLRFAVLGNTTIGRVRVRGEAQFRLTGPQTGFEKATLTAETRIGPTTDIRLGVEHEDSGRTSARLALNKDFRRFSLLGEARIDNRGQIGLGATLAFSLGPDPVDGGWRVAREKLARDGEATVTVFRDENGDGLRQPGEEGIAGVAIEAGLRKADQTTANNGRTVVNGLNPFVPVLIGIDKGSLPDPLLQPKGPGMVVVPRPGVSAQVLLPLAPTGEIEGALVNPDGVPRAGATIELVDEAGAVAARTLSEFDGYFLFDLIPYGRYRLRVAAGVAAALGVKPQLDSVVTIDRENPSHQIGVIRLESGPAPTQVAAGPGEGLSEAQ